MNAFECYKEYTAIKQHFTKPTYDYFKYNGKLKLNFQSFEKRKDKIFFEKLAKHSDPKGMLVSNLVHDNKLWIRDIAYSDAAEKRYMDREKRLQSLTYSFKEELEQLDDEFDKNFKAENGTHPYLMRLYLGGKISLETMVILVDLVKCSKHWNDKLAYDPIAEDVLIKIVKYRPFLQYDREKVKEIVVYKFSR